MGELLGIVLMLFFVFSEEVNQLKDEVPVVVKLGFGSLAVVLTLDLY